MLDVQFYQSSTEFLELAFYDPIDDEFDVDVVSATPSQIVVNNPISGWTTTLTGSGFSNPEVSLTGTVNSISIRDENGALVMAFTGASWALATFVNAMEEVVENDNEVPFNNLLSLQPVNIDGSSAIEALDLYVDGITSQVTVIGSGFDDTIVGGLGNDTLLGGDGSDEIRGGSGNDSINPGDNTNFDYVLAGAGNDTVDLGDAQSGYVELDHRDLNAGIIANINGIANTGTISKGVNGTTTILDVAAAMNADGFQVTGSNFDDTFNVTVSNGGWVSLRGLDGVDNYIINSSSGSVRIDFRSGTVQSGVNVNLFTGVIANDGFGNTETISGNGAVWEVRGTIFNDILTGSNNNESFIGISGNDTIDGGGGFDRLRFDSGGNATNLVVDMRDGIATGFNAGGALNVTFSNIEHIRGSSNADMLIADDSGVRLEGRSGNDTLIGGDGSDTLLGGDGNDSIVTGDNNDFDKVLAGAGNDTVDLSGMVNGYVSIEHGDLNTAVAINVNGNANTAVIDKGLLGTTTVIDIAAAMDADGALLFGSTAGDTFTVSASDGGFLAINGYRGADNYVVNASMGYVRLDFRVIGDVVTSGVNVNLTTGTIFNDGYGNTETITGTGFVNELRGTFRTDILTGSTRDESFIGIGGNDTISGGAGFDRLRFDSGNVAITGLNVNMATGTATGASDGIGFNMSFSGIEWVRGGDNADVILGRFADDLIEGHDGNDNIDGSNGNDTLSGDDGRDVVRGGVGNDAISGGNDEDQLYGEVGFDTIDGGAGADLIDGGTGADLLHGGDGDDRILGGDGYDLLYGDAGNDTLLSGEGPDRVYGGAGDDLIRGGINFSITVDGLFGEAGNDTIYGEGGFDYLDGGDGNDLLDGGNQADNLFGQAGNDTLLGGQGFDRLFGGDDDDYLDAGEGSDGLFGQEGNDTMIGGESDDRFFGGSGNDLILGGFGDDLIYANSGFDTIDGGIGDDLMFGLFNADTFVFAGAHGNDTIADFDAFSALEQIDLSGVAALNTIGQVLAASSQSGGNVIINTGGINSIQLNGVALGDLDASDFIF